VSEHFLSAGLNLIDLWRIWKGVFMGAYIAKPLYSFDSTIRSEV